MWSFYKGSPDTINFHNLWHGNQTYLDKVKVRIVAMKKILLIPNPIMK